MNYVVIILVVLAYLNNFFPLIFTKIIIDLEDCFSFRVKKINNRACSYGKKKKQFETDTYFRFE